MTIHHHPPDELLTAFAAGVLDLGQHIAIATHLVGCPHCRARVRAMEHVGGTVLAGLPPTEMSTGAFATVEARLGDVAPSAAAKPARACRRTSRRARSAALRARLPGRFMEMDRAEDAFASHSIARGERDAGFSSEIAAGHQNDRAHPHRLRNDLRAVGELCPCRRTFRARRFRSG